MNIGILGCGAYGMALSNILIDNDCQVTMWTKFEKEKEELEKTRKNENHIPGFFLSNQIRITTNIEECLKNKDLLIVVIPAAFMTSVALEMKPYITPNAHIVIGTKGIEQKTGQLMHEIIEKNCNTENIAVISGPSFATDIVSKMPICLSVASCNKQTQELAIKALKTKYTRLERIDDMVGIEICGAIKNIFAISSGILDGLKANESTKAAFLKEVISEMQKMIKILGGKEETALSFAGIGDLLLTCTSEKSRNYTFGKLLGESKIPNQVKEYLDTHTVEGYYTLESVYQILKEKKEQVPIIELIYNIAVKQKNPNELFTYLVEK